MAPPVADIDVQTAPVVVPVPTKGSIAPGHSSASRLSGPLTYSGTLDTYEHFDVTNVIGREFPNLQLSEILHDDDKIRDLAILGKLIGGFCSRGSSTDTRKVSQRGVVFFRNQDLSIDDQKLLGQRLGELTGKPETSKLHKHALANSKRGIAVDENGKLDDEVSVISSEQNRKYYADRYGYIAKRLASEGWHAEYVVLTLRFQANQWLTLP